MNEVLEVTGAWTELEIETYLRRSAGLQKRGMSEMDAERMAERLLMRDRPDSGDDRRLCLECAHFVKGVCKKRFPMDRMVLWRCDFFSLRGAA